MARILLATISLLVATLFTAAVASLEEQVPVALNPVARNIHEDQDHAADNFFQQVHAIGGSHAFRFRIERVAVGPRRLGHVVKKIQAWSSRDRINAVQLTFSDGHVRKIGDSIGHRDQGSITLDYDNGERVTGLWIWGNGAGQYCGAFKIVTNRNQEFFPKMYGWPLKQVYGMQVGSGIILGAHGYAQDDVNALGFLMMRKVIDTLLVIEKDDYEDLSRFATPRLVTSFNDSLENIDAEPDWIEFSQKATKKGSRSWSVNYGVTVGFQGRIQAGVPEVVEGEVTTRVDISESNEHSHSEEDGKIAERKRRVSIPGRRRVWVRAYHYETDVRALPFRGSLIHYLEGSYKFVTGVQGVYRGVSISSFKQTSVELAIYDPATGVWTSKDATVCTSQRLECDKLMWCHWAHDHAKTSWQSSTFCQQKNDVTRSGGSCAVCELCAQKCRESFNSDSAALCETKRQWGWNNNKCV